MLTNKFKAGDKVYILVQDDFQEEVKAFDGKEVKIREVLALHGYGIDGLDGFQIQECQLIPAISNELVASSIQEWVEAQGLNSARMDAQLCKIIEKFGEFTRMFNRSDKRGMEKAVGKLMVSTIVLATQNKIKPIYYMALVSQIEELVEEQGIGSVTDGASSQILVGSLTTLLAGVSQGVITNNQELILENIVALGGSLSVLVSMLGISFNKCLNLAYSEVKDLELEEGENGMFHAKK